MKRVKIFPLLAVLLFLLSMPPSSAAADKETKFEKMLNPRTITCWIEGVAVDELVIGARAKIVFVCMDRRLGREISRLRPDGNQATEYDSVPSWLRANVGDYMKQKGKTLFAVQFVTAKPWNFDLDEIRVGDYRLQREDVLLGDTLNQILPPGESAISLPSNITGQFAFYVPSELLKPGTELPVGYGESLQTWVVPKN